MLCGGNFLWKSFSSSLAVLAVLFPVHCTDYDTAPSHWHKAAISVTNERNPQSAILVSMRAPVRVLSSVVGGMKFDGGGCLRILYAVESLNVSAALAARLR